MNDLTVNDDVAFEYKFPARKVRLIRFVYVFCMTDWRKKATNYRGIFCQQKKTIVRDNLDNEMEVILIWIHYKFMADVTITPLKIYAIETDHVLIGFKSQTIFAI